MARIPRQRKIFEDELSAPIWIRPFTDPFGDAVQAARETLRKHGIKYEGLDRTFLYPDPSGTGWKQIPSDRAKLVKERSNELNPFNLDDVKWDQKRRRKKIQEWNCWLNRYPWRDCSTLQEFMKYDRIKEFSDVWYACDILKNHERTLYSQHIQHFDASSLSDPTVSGTAPYSYANMCDAYQVGLRIEVAYEALKNKPFEPHALRGMKVAEDGQSRQGKLADHTLTVMACLMEQWHSRTRAAQLTAAADFGTSKDANVQLWKRHKPANKQLGHTGECPIRHVPPSGL